MFSWFWPLRNGSRDEVEGMGDFLPKAEHRHHRPPAAPPNTGLSQDSRKSQFSIQVAFSCWGRFCPSCCQGGSHLCAHSPGARLPPGRVISGRARHPLGLRDKAIQYLQEHIWQRGSTINLPPFNTLCSRLAVAASSQQFLEAAIPLPPRLLPAGMGIRATSTHPTASPAFSGSLGPLERLHIFLFPNSLFISF